MPSRKNNSSRNHEKSVDKLSSDNTKISEARKISAKILSKSGELKADDLLKMVLLETTRLTGSKLSFFGLLEPAGLTLSDIIWHGEGVYSNRVDKLPEAIDLSKAEGWSEFINLGEPLILNSHTGDMLPVDHIRLNRYLFVPVINETRAVFILGLADKEDEYNDLDTNLISILWDSAVIEISRRSIESRLKYAEATFEIAARVAKLGVWDYDIKRDEMSIIKGLNGFIEEIAPGRKLSTADWTKMIHPDDAEEVTRKFNSHILGMTEEYRDEYRVVGIDGTTRWVQIFGRVIEKDKLGKASRMVGIHTDISDRVLAEKQLNLERIKAEESDRLKTAFLANMSHEIRTPMNGIIGFLDLLDDDGLTESQRKEYVSIVRKSSAQLLNIVNDIIDISKIESGQIVVKESQFSLKELIDELSEYFTSQLAGSPVSFITESSLPDNELNILGDSTKLRQVITNLVSNAIKFTARGSVTLRSEQVDEMVRFCIEDTGEGIAPIFHKTVFERFMQAENGFSRKQEGTGLGLSICKAYVEKMGGDIWLESEKGTGSKFYFTIPASFVDKEIKIWGRL